MWLILFFVLGVQAAPDVDFAFFKAKVQPLLLEKRPGHARCAVCHSTSTAFRLQPVPKGGGSWDDEQSHRNFEMTRKLVMPGNPQKSRLLMMPLAHEAGGTEFHPGGKHWMSKDDPEWKILAQWVNGAK
jgi:hypothetical protein